MGDALPIYLGLYDIRTCSEFFTEHVGSGQPEISGGNMLNCHRSGALFLALSPCDKYQQVTVFNRIERLQDSNALDAFILAKVPALVADLGEELTILAIGHM